MKKICKNCKWWKGKLRKTIYGGFKNCGGELEESTYEKFYLATTANDSCKKYEKRKKSNSKNN